MSLIFKLDQQQYTSKLSDTVETGTVVASNLSILLICNFL